MLECRTVRHPVCLVPEYKKITMPEQVRYRTKPTQSGISLLDTNAQLWAGLTDRRGQQAGRTNRDAGSTGRQETDQEGHNDVAT